MVIGEGVTGLDWRIWVVGAKGVCGACSDATPAKCFVRSDARRDAIDGEACGESGVARGGGRAAEGSPSEASLPLPLLPLLFLQKCRWSELHMITCRLARDHSHVHWIIN